MNNTFRSLALLLVLSGGYDSGGREVTIDLIGAGSVPAEILAVRDTAVVFTTSPGATENELAGGVREVRVVPFNQIATVRTAGSSHTLVGLFSGMAVGCLAGYRIGSSQPVAHNDRPFDCSEGFDRADNAMTGGLIGCAGGGLVGLLVGSAVRSDREVLISPVQREFAVLKSIARYPREEPAFLKRFVR